MESISADAAAQELLRHCLDGRPWPAYLLDPLIAESGNPALFRVVVERLGDLFEPRLCDVYAELFADVIAKRIPDLAHPEHLVERYRRIREPRRVDGVPKNVFVLSRVTLGADVAVTSVILDAAKRRFPDSHIFFVGPQKSWELFAADTRLRHVPIAYGRGAKLDDRLSIWPQLREAVSEPDSIVIDPDSRLTQLGLLPICSANQYFFFESRGYGGEGNESLSALARRWAMETLEVADARPYVATGLDAAEFASTVSFGVGENPDKRMADPFEEEVLKRLPRPVLVDKGVGGEEAERVERAALRAGGGIELWDGSFAGFAAHIQKSRMYLGYDSAGGHVAAASGVPMISVFAGFPSERMFARWRPTGAGKIQVIQGGEAARTLSLVSQWIGSMIP